MDDPRFGTLVACQCTIERQQERQTKLLIERSNLGPLRGKTFESFTVDPSLLPRPPRSSPEAAFKAAKSFATRPDRSEDMRLQQPKVEWLVFIGAHGSGKTHLAAAIANERLRQRRPAVFLVVPDLLDKLRATFHPSSDITYDELFETARTTPLLVLDDLGAQSSTPWAQEKLYQIINERYNRRLETAITSNLDLEDMDPRLRSRIGDTNLVEIHAIKTVDVRLGSRPQESKAHPTRRR